MQQSKVNTLNSTPIVDDYVVLKRRLAEMQADNPHYLSLSEKKTEQPALQTESGDVKSLSSNSRMSRGVGQTSSNLPWKLPETVVVRATYGFFASTAGTNLYNVTGNSLAGALGCVCYVANTTARAYAGTARIVKMSLWPPGNATTTNTVADIRWSSGPSSTFVKDEGFVVPLPVGITATRCLTFTPPESTLAGNWLNLGALSAGVILTADLSFGTVVYLTVEYTLSNNFTGATIALSGIAAVGVAGYCPLNGSGGGLTPIGKETQL
jgi:hypothetical protein